MCNHIPTKQSQVMARLSTHKMETEEDFDATRFLDRALIRLCQR